MGWQEQMERDYEEENYLRPFLKRKESLMSYSGSASGGNALHPPPTITRMPKKALTITVVLPENDEPGAALHRADVALADAGLNMVAFYTTSHYDETERPSIDYSMPPPSDWVNLS
jgi:hypothetical protein